MKYIGVNNFIKSFKEEVDWNKKAKKKAKERGISEEEVKNEWEKKRILGKEVHKRLQDELKNLPNVKSWEIDFTNSGEFYEGLPEKDEKLENGIYLERPFFSNKFGIIAFPDKVFIEKNSINVEEYKTFDKLYRTSPSLKIPGGKMIKEKFNKPISHLDVCNYIETVLQLSLYMYIIWQNNRHLKVGKLYLTHIVLDEDGVEESRNTEEVPYLREEVQMLLNYKKKKG